MIKELNCRTICATAGVDFGNLLLDYSDQKIGLVFSGSLTFEQQVIFLNFFLEAYRNDEQAFYFKVGDGFDTICLFSTGGKLKNL